MKTKINNLYEEMSRKDKLIENFIQNNVPDKYI